MKANRIKQVCLWIGFCILFLYVPVDGMELGLYLYQQEDHAASANIERSGDSEDVKQVKSLLAVMMAKDPATRPSIQEVVDNLSYLLTSSRAQQLQVPDLLKSKNNITFHLSSKTQDVVQLNSLFHHQGGFSATAQIT